MNTRIAKKILSRPYPPDKRPTERMVRAHVVYRRARRRGNVDEPSKWHCGPITTARARRRAEHDRMLHIGERMQWTHPTDGATSPVLRVIDRISVPKNKIASVGDRWWYVVPDHTGRSLQGTRRISGALVQRVNPS